jgi:hypothetical protein
MYEPTDRTGRRFGPAPLLFLIPGVHALDLIEAEPLPIDHHPSPRAIGFFAALRGQFNAASQGELARAGGDEH